MNQRLFDAFEQELAEVKIKIAWATAELQTLEGGEDRALGREKLLCLEDFERAIAKCRHDLGTAEQECQDRPLAFAKWRGHVREVHDAQIALDGFQKPIVEVRAEIVVAEKNYWVAQANLSNHLNNSLENPDFAPLSKLKKWEDQCAALKSALSERSAALRELRTTEADLTNGWMKATKKLDLAGFNARHAQPKSRQAPPARGFGQIGAVS